jgi:hypothetical protein
MTESPIPTPDERMKRKKRNRKQSFDRRGKESEIENHFQV